MKLLGKTALVTGGGRGIGQGCVLELARSGADVAINDRPGSPDLAVTAGEVRTLGRRTVEIEGDAHSRSGCEAIVARAIEELGRIDILVHNPAFSRRGDFLSYDPELFERTIAATLTSGFHASQFAARHMVQRGGGGKIIFISSVQGLVPYQGSVAYNAAKAGLNHMAKSIARELAEHRINVNVIAPGWIETPGEHETFGDESIRELGPKLPWGRIGRPADIGQAAVFLASQAADYITAEVLRVDGCYIFKDA